MADDKDGFTEAQMQIERLKRLKEERENREKVKREESFAYAEVPHMVTSPAQAAVPEETNMKAQAKPAITGQPRRAKKKLQSRLDKNNHGKIMKIVKMIKAKNSGARFTEDMFVNLALARVLELGIDFSSAGSADGVKSVLLALKREE